MEEQNSSIFSYAKLEYTNQLIDTISPHIFDGVKSVYDEAKNANIKDQSRPVLSFFRLFLERVPSWSNEIIETETIRIIEVSCCDWLDDLITAVFISHTKILTSIGSNQNANIDLTIPKTVNFIHKCYINIAREIWKNPYLYNENIIGSDYQRNMNTIESIIKEGIENTIRRSLPIKEILKQHLDTYENNNLEQQKKLLSTDFKELLLNELKELNLLNHDLPKKKIKKFEYESESEQEEQEQEKGVEEEKGEEEEKGVEEEKGGEEQEEIKEAKQTEEQEKEQEQTEYFKPNLTTSPEGMGVVKEKINYDSPDEDTIKKNCENIVINDIPDVTKDYKVSDIKEDKYDNVNISNNSSIKDNKSDLLNAFIQNLPGKNPGSPVKGDTQRLVVKKENENNLLKPDPFNDPLLFNKKEVNVGLLEGIPEDKEIKIVKKEGNKLVLKEIISVEKVDNTDTETVDEFFNDVTKLLEEKGEIIDKTTNKYTLFDDADENE